MGVRAGGKDDKSCSCNFSMFLWWQVNWSLFNEVEVESCRIDFIIKRHFYSLGDAMS